MSDDAARRAHQAMGPGNEFDMVRLMMAQWGALAVDIGDDAAVLRALSREIVATGRELIVSTDACVEGTHFLRGWLTPHEIGARAVAAALSDLAAMGARADAVLFAFVVPDLWRASLVDIADGTAQVVRPTGAKIVGGNLSHGRTFSLTTTVIGSTLHAVARRGAQTGDRLLVTGSLGGPGQAVAALYAGHEPAAWARGRFASPVPRLREGMALALAGVHAMLDISDGLAADARHLAAASGVRLRIDAACIPIGPQVDVVAALQSGEEYELLIAASVTVATQLCERWREQFDVSLTDVGEVVGVQSEGAVEIVGLPDPDVRVEFIVGHDHFTE